MKSTKKLLSISNLKKYFPVAKSSIFQKEQLYVRANEDISIDIYEGETVGVVGESGCGKSVTSLSIMQLVQAPQGQVVEGSIRFATKDYVLDGKGKRIRVCKRDDNGEVLTQTQKDKHGNDVLDKQGLPVIEPVYETNEDGLYVYEMQDKVYDICKMPTEDMARVRGKDISMIFQEPMTSLNPVFTVGYQIEEVVYLINPLATKAQARAKAIKMLQLVGIPMPETIIDYYPHQLSGGMRQRVMIAIALTGNPKLIIADEPTTALDVTIQSQILQLIKSVQKQCGASVMLITHDLGVIAEMADYVVVMYAGKVIEMGTAEDIYDRPLHPYTIGLQKSKPTVDAEVDELYCIPGFVPNPINMPDYCYFRDRCEKCTAKCSGEYPKLIKVSPTHSVSCYLYEEQSEEK